MHLQEADISDVVEIHRRAFPSSRSTSLGRPYVRKMFKWFLEYQPQLCLAAKEDKRIVGYVIGSKGGYGRKLFRYALPEIVIGLLLHPRLWWQPQTYTLWRSYLRGLVPEKNINLPSYLPSVGKITIVALAGIGVDPDLQGKGIGQSLVLGFENAAREVNAKRLSLSVHLNNHGARRLYEKCGWQMDHEDIQHNSVHYIKVLDI